MSQSILFKRILYPAAIVITCSNNWTRQETKRKREKREKKKMELSCSRARGRRLAPYKNGTSMNLYPPPWYLRAHECASNSWPRHTHASVRKTAVHTSFGLVVARPGRRRARCLEGYKKRKLAGSIERHTRAYTTVRRRRVGVQQGRVSAAGKTYDGIILTSFLNWPGVRAFVVFLRPENKRCNKIFRSFMKLR